MADNDAHYPLVGTALEITFPIIDLFGVAVTSLTSPTYTLYRDSVGAATPANAPTHIGKGLWKWLFTAAELTGVYRIAATIEASNCPQVFIVFYTSGVKLLPDNSDVTILAANTLHNMDDGIITKNKLAADLR